MPKPDKPEKESKHKAIADRLKANVAAGVSIDQVRRVAYGYADAMAADSPPGFDRAQFLKDAGVE